MRGFTTASEGKSPDAVAALAQKCLETLTQVVYQYGGTIEKYSGDGLMAVWGAPKRDLEHAKHAVEAGLQMQVAVKGLKDWFRQNGFEPMRVSVGINTGEGAVGIFGGEAHLAWTAHGDAVNVASRIEQLTRVIGVDLLIGRRTAELYGLANTKDCGEHQVKGRIAPVKIYQIDL
jgi:adenylate cyclase